MKRTLANRLAALGLLAVFQASAAANLEHVGCLSSAMGTHGASMVESGSGPHHGPAPAEMAHAGPMDEHAGHSGTHRSPDGSTQSCCDGPCVCPQVQPGLVHPAVGSGLAQQAIAHRLPLPHDSPAFARSLYLLPLPNGPPSA